MRGSFFLIVIVLLLSCSKTNNKELVDDSIHVFIGLFVIICCNNDDKQINNFEQEQNNKEYLTALKLIQGFSKEQNQDLSRNAANKLIITNIEKGSINCTDKQIISR